MKLDSGFYLLWGWSQIEANLTGPEAIQRETVADMNAWFLCLIHSDRIPGRAIGRVMVNSSHHNVSLGPVAHNKIQIRWEFSFSVTQFSSWWPLFPSRSSVLIYIYIYIFIYIYVHFLYEFCYRTYIYIQQEWHSVLVKLHTITFYRTVLLGSAHFLGWMPLVVFFGLPIVSCSVMIIV